MSSAQSHESDRRYQMWRRGVSRASGSISVNASVLPQPLVEVVFFAMVVLVGMGVVAFVATVVFAAWTTCNTQDSSYTFRKNKHLVL